MYALHIRMVALLHPFNGYQVFVATVMVDTWMESRPQTVRCRWYRADTNMIALFIFTTTCPITPRPVFGLEIREGLRGGLSRLWKLTKSRKPRRLELHSVNEVHRSGRVELEGTVSISKQYSSSPCHVSSCKQTRLPLQLQAHNCCSGWMVRQSPEENSLTALWETKQTVQSE